MSVEERHRELLLKHATGKMTTAELLVDVAYWLIESFGELRPKHYPSVPYRYQEYLSSSYEEKKQYNNNFWQLPEIKDYLDSKIRIKNENLSNLMNLNEYKNYIPEKDTLNHGKYQQKINEFEAHIQNIDRVYEPVRAR